MELNGLIAFTVILGTIGHVWCLCLNKTQTLHSHSCVHRTDAGSNLFEQDITPPTETSSETLVPKIYFVFKQDS